MKKIIGPICLAAFVVACAHHYTLPATDSATETKLRAALSGPQRTEAERARDQYRHPVETLKFFGLRDDMHVVELFPGGGWYTAILAPVLRDRGHLMLAATSPEGPDDMEGVPDAKKLKARLAAAPDVYDRVEWKSQPTGGLAYDLGKPNSADLVVTFRNIHGMQPAQLEFLIKRVYAVLKPGGVFAIEDHRAPNVPAAHGSQYAVETGYVDLPDLVKFIERNTMLRLAAESEINANPKDTKDYDKGVWALPPTLANGETDKAKYLAIGESDRFTIAFVKPF